jgi:two-component system sensor histidine kinase DesK
VQLERLRDELSRVAVIQERLRISRDVHDLLGLGLYAIALKSDLATRLIGHDDARAAVEIAELGRICAASRADMREVTEDGGRLSLSAELAAAGQILSSAGVEVAADVPACPLPEPADTVLAPVLREAVTNVLRHSTATCCTIQLVATDHALRLRVSNDGGSNRVVGPATARRSGRGLANLTARVEAAGGRVWCDQAGGGFDLVAEIPLPVPNAGPTRHRRSYTAAL